MVSPSGGPAQPRPGKLLVGAVPANVRGRANTSVDEVVPSVVLHTLLYTYDHPAARSSVVAVLYLALISLSRLRTEEGGRERS